MDITTIIIIAVIALYVIFIFNKLVTLKNRFKNAFAQIEVQLKRRYDLIPNLVDTAKGYLKHEAETLKTITEARNSAQNALQQAASNPANASSINGLSKAEAALNNSLGKFNLVMEAYPDLKANQNMMQLSEELTSTENKISFSRQAFNDAVTAYNIFRQSFPNMIFAGIFGHGTDATLLEFEDSAKFQDPVKTSF